MWCSKEMDVQFEELYASDPKDDCVAWRLAYGPRPRHHFADVLDAACAHEVPALCAFHNRRCRRSATQEDIFIAGFPCQPSSGMRTGRWTAGSPANHQLAQVADRVIEALHVSRPRCAVLENVLAMGFASRQGGESDELSKFVAKIVDRGVFFVLPVKITLSAWCRAERERLYILIVRRDVGDADCLERAANIARPGISVVAYALLELL